MRFYVRKRKQTPTIIVVALIDVLIVLLIFLMVTTTFKQQPALKLALPESTQAQKTGASEDVPLIVSVDKQGNLRLGTQGEGLPVTVDDFRAKLKEAVEKNPELKLAIRADTEAPFGKIVKLMDATKEAKVKVVNAFTKEPGK
ncbi:MAG TPA: biopolymer transporter ExbD [Verrucomicrobiae bacterium]|nr:biopolymer transporter ExbD [Verrucomicrobiae bacterium]